MGDTDQGCYVYVLRCADGSLYTGCARDLRRRLGLHQAGKGARYTRARLPVEIVAAWLYPDRSAALRAEYAFKRVGRQDKLAAVASSPALPL